MKVLMIGNDPKFKNNLEHINNKFKVYLEQKVELTLLNISTGESYNFTDNPIKIYSVGGKNKLFTLLNNFKLINKLYNEGKNFDVITSQDLIYTAVLGFYAKILFKCELVPQVHGDYVNNPLWLKQSKLRKFENFIAENILNRTYFLRTVSKRIIKDIKKYLPKDAEIISSPIGTNFEKFYPQKELPKNRGKNILFVGRLIEEKNPILFCETMEELWKVDTGFIAHFAGSGVMETELRNYFKRIGKENSVVFHGNLDADELRYLYQNSLCYVHTALWEGWGIPMIESCASGCPVVTTDTGCVGEALIENAHCLVEKPEKQAFSLAVLKLSKDENLQKELALNGSRDMLEFELNTQTKKFINFLRKAAYEKNK